MATVPRKGVVYCEDGADNDTIDIHALFVKRARGSNEGIVTSKQPTVPAQDDLARASVPVLLRLVYFLNEERTRYVSVGFYTSDKYQVLVELGGPWIEPIRLAEQHVRNLMEALPALLNPMQCGELYMRKNSAFRIRTGKTHNCARMYHGRQCISFKLADLRYMATMLHMVAAQQSQYILAQADVKSYAYGMLGSLVVAQPQRSGDCRIQYDQLFAELKLQLI